MKKIYNLSAFTLAEMMVVLLILSIITAAFMPVITGKMRSTASNTGPWKYVNGANGDIYYNEGDTTGAVIGTNAFAVGDNARLLINKESAGQDHILFKNGNVFEGRMGLAFGGIGLGRYSTSGSTLNGSVGLGTVGIGNDVRITGSYGIGIGAYTGSYGDRGIAIGEMSTAGASSVAIGDQATASVNKLSNPYSTQGNASSVAIGNGAYSSGDYAVSVGRSASATKASTVAIGDSSRAQGISSIAIGIADTTKGTTGTSDYAVAIGYHTLAGAGASNIAIGNSATTANGHSYSTAIGYNTTSNESSVALGNTSKADGSYSVAIGTNAYSYSANSVAIGYNVTNSISADYSVAIGYGASTSGISNGDESNIAIGYSSVANNQHSIAIGYDANASNAQNIAIGTMAGYNVTRANKTFIGYRAGEGSDSNYNDDRPIMYFGAHTGDTQAVQIFPEKNGGKASRTDYTGATLVIKGDVLAVSGDYNKTSDRRLKDVGPLFTAGLDKVRLLRPYNYKYKRQMFHGLE